MAFGCDIIKSKVLKLGFENPAGKKIFQFLILFRKHTWSSTDEHTGAVPRQFYDVPVSSDKHSPFRYTRRRFRPHSTSILAVGLFQRVALLKN